MMGETGPMGLHSKGRKTDMKTAAKRERKTLRIVELALLLGAAAFLMTGVWALNTQRDLADKVVRLHVLANSDTEEDQALKLLVRDAVLERATEILEQSADRAEAEIRLRESLPELEAIAEETVRANGYDYAVTAELEDTSFPTKEYDGFALPAGEYLCFRSRIFLDDIDTHRIRDYIREPPPHTLVIANEYEDNLKEYERAEYEIQILL